MKRFYWSFCILCGLFCTASPAQAEDNARYSIRSETPPFAGRLARQHSLQEITCDFHGATMV